MFVSLLYSSHAAPGIDSGDVFEIIEVSARNNPARDVTGFLLFDGSSFLQYVEGSQAALDTLLATLDADARHHSVTVLHRADITARLFPKWAMRRAGAGAEAEIATIRRVGLPVPMIATVENFGTRRRAA